MTPSCNKATLLRAYVVSVCLSLLVYRSKASLHPTKISRRGGGPQCADGFHQVDMPSMAESLAESLDFVSTFKNTTGDVSYSILPILDYGLRKDTTSSLSPLQNTRPSNSTLFVDRLFKVATRVLHPSLVSSFCVARELLEGGAVPSGAELVAMYCVHVLIFSADRLGDQEGYDQTILKHTIGVALVAFGLTANLLSLAALSVFALALAAYPKIKQVPYLKCLWVPLAFTQAACSGAGMVPFWKGGFFVPYAFLYYFGNCAACDIKDIEEDRSRGVQTVATRLGARRMRWLSAVSTILSALILLVGSGMLSEGAPFLGLQRYPAVWGCVFSTILYTLGLLVNTRRNPKDLDMLNSIPLVVMLVVHKICN